MSPKPDFSLSLSSSVPHGFNTCSRHFAPLMRFHGGPFHIMLLPCPGSGNSPGNSFWMGWWGYAKRQESTSRFTHHTQTHHSRSSSHADSLILRLTHTQTLSHADSLIILVILESREEAGPAAAPRLLGAADVQDEPAGRGRRGLGGGGGD